MSYPLHMWLNSIYIEMEEFLAWFPFVVKKSVKSWIFCHSQQAWATDDIAQIYDKCITELEQHLHAIPPSLAMNPQAQALRNLLEAVVMARNSRDAIAALGLLQKASTL